MIFSRLSKHDTEAIKKHVFKNEVRGVNTIIVCKLRWKMGHRILFKNGNGCYVSRHLGGAFSGVVVYETLDDALSHVRCLYKSYVDIHNEMARAHDFGIAFHELRQIKTSERAQLLCRSMM